MRSTNDDEVIPTMEIVKVRRRPRLLRKEREKIAKRQEIVAAAREVFAHKGFTHATLDEIAERAEFAKGTLYNYFPSKEELFQHIVETMLDDLTRVARVALRTGGSARQVFHRYGMQVIEYYKANEDLLRIVAREMNRMQLEEEHRRIVAILERVQAIVRVLAGVLRKEIKRKRLIQENPQELANIFVAMIHNWSMRRFFEGKGLQSLDSEKEAAFIVRLFFEGASLSRGK